MARLSAADRAALPKSAFLVPSKAPGPGSYPVPDAGHQKAAIGLAGHAGKKAPMIRAMARRMLKKGKPSFGPRGIPRPPVSTSAKPGATMSPSAPMMVDPTTGKPITSIPIPMSFPFPGTRQPPRNTY